MRIPRWHLRNYNCTNSSSDYKRGKPRLSIFSRNNHRLSLLFYFLVHSIVCSNPTFAFALVPSTNTILTDIAERRRLLFSSRNHDIDKGNVKDAQGPMLLLSTSSSSSSPSSSCPFSRTFPRFRIRLTSSADKSTNSKKDKNPLFAFFGSSSSSRDSSSVKNDSQQQLRAVQKANPGRPIRWVTQQDGIQAYASMWRGVVDLQQQQQQQKYADDDKLIDYLVLGFPHAKAQILQNFCEIFDWAKQQQGLLWDSDTMEAQFQPAGPAICFSIRRPVKVQNQQHQQLETAMYNNPDEYTEILNRRTRAWVDRVLVNMGICPFTKSSKTSGQGLADLGVPVGRIAYHASFVNTTTTSSNGRPQFDVARLMADTWEAIDAMIKAGPRYQDGGISSILLAAPDFDDHLDIWAGPVFAMLEAGVMAARAEKDVGVVCFHPKYATPDGTTWPGFGHMHSVPRLQKWILQQQEEQEEEQREAELEKKRLAMIAGDEDITATSLVAPIVESPLLILDGDDDELIKTDDTSLINAENDNDNYCQVAAGGAWQRRTPHATINVLRADQLEIAEKKRNTAHLYPKNIAKLLAIGNDQLQQDLNRERSMT